MPSRLAPMEGVRVAPRAHLHVAAPTVLLAEALTALGRLGRTPVLAEAPLPRVVIARTRERVEVIALDLSQWHVALRVAHVEGLVILRRQ